MDEGTHPDFLVIRPPDDKDIGIDQIRSMIESVGSYPMFAPCKVVMIENADRLTGAAANATLKILEEPPHTVRFYLLAESPRSLLPTIRSRCGLVLYQRLSEPFIVSVIQRFEPDSAKAVVYCRMAEGSVGRAVQYWGSGRLGLRDKAFALVKYGLKKDVASLFTTVDAMNSALPLGLRFLEHILFDLRMVRMDSSLLINLDLAEELMEVRAQLSDTTWHHLVTKLHQTRMRYQTTRILLPFHVKSFLTTAFLGS